MRRRGCGLHCLTRHTETKCYRYAAPRYRVSGRESARLSGARRPARPKGKGKAECRAPAGARGSTSRVEFESESESESLSSPCSIGAIRNPTARRSLSTRRARAAPAAHLSARRHVHVRTCSSSSCVEAVRRYRAYNYSTFYSPFGCLAARGTFVFGAKPNNHAIRCTLIARVASRADNVLRVPHPT